MAESFILMHTNEKMIKMTMQTQFADVNWFPVDFVKGVPHGLHVTLLNEATGEHQDLDKVWIWIPQLFFGIDTSIFLACPRQSQFPIPNYHLINNNTQGTILHYWPLKVSFTSSTFPGTRIIFPSRLFFLTRTWIHTHKKGYITQN